MTWGHNSSLMETRVLNATVTLTVLVIETNLLRMTQVLPSHRVAGSCLKQDVGSFGHQSCRPRLHYLPPKLSTSPCLNLYGAFFLLCFWFKRFKRKDFQSSVPSPTYTTRFLRITPVHWNLLGFQSFILVPSSSTCVTIIFANTQTREKWSHQDLSNRTKNQIADALTKALP